MKAGKRKTPLWTAVLCSSRACLKQHKGETIFGHHSPHTHPLYTNDSNTTQHDTPHIFFQPPSLPSPLFRRHKRGFLRGMVSLRGLVVLATALMCGLISVQIFETSVFTVSSDAVSTPGRGDAVLRAGASVSSSSSEKVVQSSVPESSVPDAEEEVPNSRVFLTTKTLEADGLPETCKMNDKFAEFVKKYLQSQGPARKDFIYSCEPNKKRFCGGTGDRLRGITTSLFLAMATNRNFRIFSPFPAEYTEFYDKAYVDWGISYQEADKTHVDSSLMHINKIRKYVTHLSKTADNVRVQSNAYDVTHDALSVPTLRRSIEQEMGLRNCNLSCYYGCMFDLLFTPNEGAKKAIQETVGSRTKFIGMQVRVSGKWAVGLQVPEKWRTHPQSFHLFWEALDELFKNPQYSGAGLFVTTDAPKFLELVSQRYKDKVFYTPGEQFNHTDSSELHALKPDKFKIGDSKRVKIEKFKLTLLNHYILGMGDAMVMAQSGFGDTAFWRTKKSATCLFVDIGNYRHVWRHSLVYTTPDTSVSKVRNHIYKINPPD